MGLYYWSVRVRRTFGGPGTEIYCMNDLGWCGSAERVNVWGWEEGGEVMRRPSTREIRRVTVLEPQHPRRSKRLLGIVRLHQASSCCITGSTQR